MHCFTPLLTALVLAVSAHGLDHSSMDPRAEFAVVDNSTAVANPFPVQSCNGLDIKDVTIDRVQKWFAAGNLTALQFAQCYVDRLALMNPYVRHVIEINPDYKEIASALDAERANGTVRGPMHGIPILVKDNIGTDDKMNTTEGNLVLLGSKVNKDAHVISRLRASGAIILGHANMAEYADHRAIISFAEAYSSRGGQTRNVWNGTQQTAGSSSGSAQAVAGYNIIASVGTETHGSILHPAGHAGVVGLKPTVGLTSREGVVPGSHNQDTIGAFARNTKDAAYVLDALYGIDAEDDKTLYQLGHTPKDGYAAHATDKSALAGAVFGIPYWAWWSTIGGLRAPGNEAKFLARIDQLRAAGATIINITEPLPYAKEIANEYGWGDAQNTPWALASQRYLLVDMAVTYQKWLTTKITWPAGRDGLAPLNTLGDVVVWNINNNATTGGLGSAAFKSGQDALIAAVATGGIRDDVYWNALSWRQARAQACIDGGYMYTFENGTTIELDGLLIPNAGGGGAASSLASVPAYAGYPAITVPIDLDGFSCPMGLGIWGRKWGEAKLIKWASAMEDLFQFNKNFEPTYEGYDTTKIPFDARWPGYSCTTDSLAHLGCTAAVAA